MRVDKGWRDRREINTVVFDPGEIRIEEMEEALKKAETYIDTISPVDDDKSSNGTQSITEEQERKTTPSQW